MNSAVSPDLDALICYSIVFVVGAIASIYQLWINLGGLLGVWTIFEAWAVFLVYSVVPVVLFWLLDRTGAISDTSVFAALIVGFGYQQILSGQSSLQGPPEAASFSQFLAVWTTRMLPRIRDRMAANNARFRDATAVAVAADPAEFEKLKQLALGGSADPAALNQQLAEIETQRQALGNNGVLEKQAKALYDTISAVNDFRYLLMRRKIISRSTYWWYAREYRSKAIVWSAVLASVLLFVLSIRLVQTPRFRTLHYVWRLEKADASKVDRFRTREALLEMMRKCDDAEIYVRISKALENDSLPPDVIGRATDILIEGQPSAAACKFDLLSLMLKGLRNADPDSRTRIQSAVVYIAGLQRVSIPDGFSAWHPSSQDSGTSIDAWIRKWQSELAKPEQVGVRRHGGAHRMDA